MMNPTSKKTMPYPLRLPRHLLELADLRAEEERVDRAMALRQLLYSGAEDYVMELLGQGRISLSKAAELLDTSTVAVMQKAEKRGMVLGATKELYEQARTALKKQATDRKQAT
jgi:hypothetical protein